MFEKLSMDSLTTMTGGAYRLWDTAKGYFAADSGQDDKDNHQAKTQDNQDSEKTSASLLSSDQQDISWSMPHPKKLLMLASLGLAYYTHQAGYHDNYDNHGVDISYAIDGMDFTSHVPFQTTSDWSFAIPSSAGAFSQLAMLYGASSLLSNSYQYNAANLFIAPLSLMALSNFLPILPAQNIETEFLKVFGGNLGDYGNTIKITSTGDMVVAGYTQSFGNQDVLVAKFYANSSLAWSCALGGSGVDRSYALALTPADDIIVAGQTTSFGAGGFDMLVVKLYANGSLVWARTLGGGGADSAQALALTPADDIVLAGTTSSFGAGSTDVLVAKLDANGNLLWACALGGSSSDEGIALIITLDDDIVVTGYTFSFGAGSGDFLTAKLYVNGSLAWTRTLGGSNNDIAYASTQTTTGDIIIAGGTNGYGNGYFDVLLAKLDANGNLTWAQTLEGNGADFGYTLALTSSNDIVVAGQTNSFGAGNEDVLVTKFDANGSFAWARTLGGSSTDYGNALALTSSNDIVVTGQTNSFGAGGYDVLLAKFSANGNTSDCNLSRTAQLTVLNLNSENITNSLITPTFTSISTIGAIRNWTTISSQFITPQELRLCLVNNASISTQPSVVTATTMASSSLSSNDSPSNSLTATSLFSSTFSSTSNPSTSPISDMSVSSSSASSSSLVSSSISTSNTNNSSSSSPILNIIVPTTPLGIEQGTSIILTNTTLSITGNVNANQVIYTIIGNNPDIIITVNGLAVTQFTQEDVEGNFVEISLPGVTCGDDYSTDLQLEANIAGSNVPAQQVSINLLFDITTCSYAGRLSLFSYRDTDIGFWANNKPKERVAREAKMAQPIRENTINSIRFRP